MTSDVSPTSTADADPSSELLEARQRLAELEAAEADRRHAEKVQAALYRVAELASAAQDLQEFYRAVHAVVGELMYANNFFIALYDEERQLINWPYYSDEVDFDIPDPDQWDAFGEGNARGTTAYVLRTGEPQLLSYAGINRLIEQGEVELVGVTVEESTWLGVPLKSEGQTLGALVIQSYTKEFSYTEQDKELLAYVGQHVGAALSRARAIEETRRRNAELAFINSVQQAIAGELDPQAIYDVVGEKLHDVFDAQVVDIAVYDEAAQLLRFPYTLERGVRYPDEPLPLIGFRRHVIETREPLMLNEDLARESENYGNPEALTGEPSKSGIWMPVVAGDKAIGVISLQNIDREHAFTDSDLQLLATLAGSLSVALENARLVHETRQRVAELATVNSVGQALASQLELDALIELVGERVRDTFEADIVYLALHEEAAGRIDFAYYSENGQRRDQPSLKYGEGFTSRILDSREPLVLNRPEQYQELGMSRLGTPSRSYLGVPIVVGEKAIGVVSIQSIEEEGRFGEAEAGLLATIAASVGVAIQNARLFQAQRDAERQYRQLVEELPLAVYTDTADVTMTSEYISPRVEEMLGYPREAWRDPEFTVSVLHPDDRDRVVADTALALARKDERWSMEYRMVAADGRTVWVRDDAWIVKDDDGNPTHVQGFMIDVTDQAFAHAEIRRQKQYFESLVEISPVAIVVMDADERVTGWNPAAAELFGWSTEEAVGKPIDELVFESDSSEEGREVTHEALVSGRAQRIGRRSRKDGSPVDVELMLVPLTVEGKLVGFFAIYHDITELQRAQQEAEAATQAKSAFLAAMSHEIRTPMNAIIGMSGLLLRSDLDDEQREHASIVRTSSEALLRIIDDILDYSKIEAGRMELELQPFDLRECVNEVLALIASVATIKDLALAASVSEEVPPALVGDVSRLRQILINVMNNAVKFTERGRIDLRVETGSPQADGQFELRLSVRDTGIGLTEEQLGRLFQSFSQADASINRRFGGTGLGLAISKRLAEAMGGTMWAESDGPGRGSTFFVTISTRAASGSPVASAGRLPHSGELDSEHASRHPLRILLVEDNAVNQKLALRLLSQMGYSADVAGNGLEALEALNRQRYDLVLMDVQMPEMDGLEATRRIVASVPAEKRPWIVAMTANAMEGDREACLEAGMNSYIAKPIRVEELVGAVLAAPSSAAVP